MEYTQKKENAVKNGRFLINIGEDTPEFTKLVSKIPDNYPQANNLRRQIKDAFMFNDREMILELKGFVIVNFLLQPGLFS